MANNFFPIAEIQEITTREITHYAEAHILSSSIMRIIQYISFKLDITIPPHSEIRVDSKAFTAFLGQQNILSEYKGEWLHVTRNTKRIDIKAEIGGEIDGEISLITRFI